MFFTGLADPSKGNRAPSYMDRCVTGSENSHQDTKPLHSVQKPKLEWLKLFLTQYRVLYGMTALSKPVANNNGHIYMRHGDELWQRSVGRREL